MQMIAGLHEFLSVGVETDAECQMEMIEHVDCEVLPPDSSEARMSPARAWTYPVRPSEHVSGRPLPLITVGRN